MKFSVIIFFCFIMGLGMEYITHSYVFSSEQIKETSPPVSKAPVWTRHKSINISSLSSSQPLRHIIARILKGDTSLNLEEALEQILNSKGTPEQKQDALILLFSHWADIDLNEALKKIESLDYSSFSLHFIKREIFMKMIANDPKEAAQYYKSNRDALYAHEHYFLPEVVRQLATQAPEEAWKWVLSLNDTEQNDAVNAFFSGLKPSPDIMKKFLDQVNADAGLRENVSISRIIKNWAKLDFESALNWINSLSENSEKQHFIESLIVGGAENDFDQAIHYLSQVQDNSLPRVLASVAKTIQKKQGTEAALNWMVENTPKDSLYSDFEILGDWSAVDPESARKWVLQLPREDFKIKSYALEAYARTSSDRNYGETLKMAEDIRSTEIKKTALRSVILNWLQYEPAAAREWVDNYEGTEDIKKELEEIVNKEKT